TIHAGHGEFVGDGGHAQGLGRGKAFVFGELVGVVPFVLTVGGGAGGEAGAVARGRGVGVEDERSSE
ncbi:MAG TPA: hypothetical protein VGI45_16645, partial [Terracidiphilus sp.]